MDIAILNGLQTLRTVELDTFMVLITHLGDVALMWIIAAATLLAQPKRRVYGIALVAALVSAALLGAFVLKPLFDRPRPFEALGFTELLIPAPFGSSFPSNHSMVSFAAASVLCCLPKGGKGVSLVKIFAVIMACLVALSRLYLYVHYPSDVAAGALIGIAVGLLCVALSKKWCRAPTSSTKP